MVANFNKSSSLSIFSNDLITACFLDNMDLFSYCGFCRSNKKGLLNPSKKNYKTPWLICQFLVMLIRNFHDNFGAILIASGNGTLQSQAWKFPIFFKKKFFFLYYKRDFSSLKNKKKTFWKKFLFFSKKIFLPTFWGDCLWSHKIKNSLHSRMTAD